MEADRYRGMTKAAPPNAPTGKSRNNKVGRRFGRLVVIAAAPSRLRTSKRSDTGAIRWETYWTIKCDCGQIRDVKNTSLVSGKTKSCGCLRIDTLANPDPIAQVFKLYGDNVRRQRPNTRFRLTRIQFESLIMGDCFYCGAAPAMKIKHSRGMVRNTIDRKNAFGHYDSKNCVTCCWPCNRMKRTMTPAQFIEQACKITAHQS